MSKNKKTLTVAVKENICIRGRSPRCGSKMLENYVSPYDAEVIDKLKKAGVIIGEYTGMDEFAMGSTSETSYYGIVENPVKKGYSPGGSSGGSAAAAALGKCDAALGSDTGGSVRLPSAYCGVVGLKPTYGAVSRYGLVSYASSMDVIGVIARDTSTVSRVFNIIKGRDDKDSTSVDYDSEKAKYIKPFDKDYSRLSAAVPGNLIDTDECPLEPSVREAYEKTIERLKGLGIKVSDCDVSLAKYAVPAYYVIASAEASSNLSRFDGVRYGFRAETYSGLHDMYKKTRTEGFGEEVKKRIMLGTFALSEGFYDEYYVKAAKIRRLITEEYSKIFGKYDLIVLPTAAGTAPMLGSYNNDKLRMYKNDMFTVPANLTGMPAVSFPAGTDDKGLPIGMQLMGNYYSEELLLKVACELYLVGEDSCLYRW